MRQRCSQGNRRYLRGYRFHQSELLRVAGRIGILQAPAVALRALIVLEACTGRAGRGVASLRCGASHEPGSVGLRSADPDPRHHDQGRGDVHQDAEGGHGLDVLLAAARTELERKAPKAVPSAAVAVDMVTNGAFAVSASSEPARLISQSHTR